MSEYLSIVDAGPSPSGKTRVWSVCSVNRGSRLGVVRWYGAWRQYAYWPDPGTLYNPDCLREIAEFCAEQTRLHRERVVA